MNDQRTAVEFHLARPRDTWRCITASKLSKSLQDAARFEYQLEQDWRRDLSGLNFHTYIGDAVHIKFDQV